MSKIFNPRPDGDIDHTGIQNIGTTTHANIDNLLQTWNGTFLEEFTFAVTSNGTTITGTLDKDPTGDLTEVFSDGLTTMTSGTTVTLTAGTDTTPQKNFVYVLQSNKGVLTVSTSDWPAAEHIKVAEVIVQSAATVQTDGVLANRFWNDHTKGTDAQGHFSHVYERLRWEHSAWKSGSAVTWTITPQVGIPDNVDLAITAGKTYQMHLQNVAAFDTSTGGKVYVVNDSTTPYTSTSDIEDLLTDSTGVSMAGKYFNLVIWCSVSSGSEQEQIFINLPSGSYNKQSDAENDVSSFDTFTIPDDFRGYAYLIQRVTFRHQNASGGTWTKIQETDLRGQTPSIASGGGAGGTVTEFADDAFKLFDDVDVTKELQFQLSGLTTATTRTLTVPDVDDTIVALAASQTLTNKTIDANNNTISNLAHGVEVDEPSSNVHGITGSIVGTTDTQTLTNKTLTSPVLDGAIDAGGATSLEIPNSATPTVNAAGEIALDTSVASFDPQIKFYDGANEQTVISLRTADLTTTDNHVIVYDSVLSRFKMEAQSGGGGGGGHTIRDDGVDMTGRTGLNFIGPILTVADDAINDETEIDIDETQIDHDNLTNFLATEHFTQAAITTVGTVTTGNVDAVVSDASLTTKGKVELATVAETNTGTDATRAVTPDGLDGWTGSAQITTLGTITSGTWQGSVITDVYLQDASKTQQGVVELATTAEIDTGTDTTRAIPIDQFVASDRNIRFLTFVLIASDTDVATDTSIGGDFTIPFTGTIIQDDSKPDFFAAYTDTAGTGGTMVVDVHLNGTTIMTTNKLDIETTEKDTTTAATQPDLTTTAVTAGDILTFDIDAIHSTTAAKGLKVTIAIRMT